MKIFPFVLLLFVAFQANGQKTTHKTITVKPNKYLQNYEHFKRLVLDADDGHAEYIEGFDFEWGYDYKLKVEVTKLEPGLSDGTLFDFKLDEVISKTKVPDSTEFRLFINPLLYYYIDEEMGDDNYTIKKLQRGLYLYCNEVEIEVPDELIDSFEKVRNGEQGAVGFFTFVNEKRIKLKRL